MKYQNEENEENKKMINDNKLQSNIEQEQPIQKIQPEKPKWIYINPSIYLMYCLLNGFSILLGSFMKLIYPKSRDEIGKKSIITGIPLIRNNYFVGPIILNLSYFIWCIYIFYNNTSIRAKYQNSVLYYLKNIRGAYFFTNIFLMIIFYVLYLYITIPIYKSYGFKLSGHVIASILSGGMIVNLHNTYEPFGALNLRKFDIKFNKYIFLSNMFLYYHSVLVMPGPAFDLQMYNS